MLDARACAVDTDITLVHECHAQAGHRALAGLQDAKH